MTMRPLLLSGLQSLYLRCLLLGGIGLSVVVPTGCAEEVVPTTVKTDPSGDDKGSDDEDQDTGDEENDDGEPTDDEPAVKDAGKSTGKIDAGKVDAGTPATKDAGKPAIDACAFGTRA
ncbi:MAG: hypothetical protein RLZZ450_6302 [Pseudomonadota bacterium]